MRRLGQKGVLDRHVQLHLGNQLGGAHLVRVRARARVRVRVRVRVRDRVRVRVRVRARARVRVRTVVSVQCSVFSGQWSVVSGQWSVVSGVSVTRNPNPSLGGAHRHG